MKFHFLCELSPKLNSSRHVFCYPIPLATNVLNLNAVDRMSACMAKMEQNMGLAAFSFQVENSISE